MRTPTPSLRKFWLLALLGLLLFGLVRLDEVNRREGTKRPPPRDVDRSLYVGTLPPALPSIEDPSNTSTAEVARIDGVVLDEDKQPVPNATVTMMGRTTVSDEAGAFFFADVPSGETVVRASLGARHGKSTTFPGVLDELLEIELLSGPRLVVHVVSARGGTPIAGATVSISGGEELTDATGTVTFPAIARDGVYANVTAPGFARGRGEGAIDEEHPQMPLEITIALSPGVTISGIAVDEKGDRVPNATIDADAGDRRLYAWADEAGVWTLENAPAGTWAFTGSSSKHIEVAPQVFETDGVKPRTNVVIRMRLGATIHGRVVDDRGAPIEGATIYGLSSGDSDAEGRFVATGLRSEAFTIHASTPKGVSKKIEVDLRTGPAPTLVTLVVRATTLSGRVVDTHGDPVADVTLFASSTGTDGERYAATSNEYGAFDFGGVQPDDYEIVAQRQEFRARPYPPPSLVVHAPARDVKLVLPAAGKVVGRVVLDGRPVTYYGIAFTQDASTVYGQTTYPISDERGELSRTDIEPGTWSVVIVGPDFAKKTIDNIVVREGQVTDLGTINVTRGRVVTGRVIDQTGRAIPHALVVAAASLTSLSDSRVQQRMSEDFSTNTDGSGAFELAGLSLGDLRIVASEPSAGTSLEAPLDADATSIVLTVIATGDITGRIENMSGHQRGVLASAKDESGTRVSGDIDALGRFRIAPLPPGEYDVTVNGDNVLAGIVVTVAARRTSEVTFVMPTSTVATERY